LGKLDTNQCVEAYRDDIMTSCFLKKNGPIYAGNISVA
jgi:hypothetical protein